MKHDIIKIVIITLSLSSSISYAGDSAQPWVELIIKPLAATKSDSQIRLLPIEDELIDGNAISLYDKAIKTFPEDFQIQQFADWRKLPSDIDQLPVVEIENALKKLKPTIDLLTQASKCNQCNWPLIRPELAQQIIIDDIKIYRYFSYILDVQAKLQITQGQYDEAIETIKKNMTIAKNLGGAPSLVQAMVGISIGVINTTRIEHLIQSDNSPNLYNAIKNLPRPLADANIAIKYETDNLKNYNILLRIVFQKQLKSSHDVIRKQMNYLERRIAVLQCIEALRLYAGSHGGKFPEKLSDVTEYEIPKDPVTKEPFIYKSIGTEAVLELKATENSDGRDSIQYEIILKK